MDPKVGRNPSQAKGRSSLGLELTCPGHWPLTCIAPGQGGDCCGDGFSTFDVPIFTEEFLDQNKGTKPGGGGGFNLLGQ